MQLILKILQGVGTRLKVVGQGRGRTTSHTCIKCFFVKIHLDHLKKNTLDLKLVLNDFKSYFQQGISIESYMVQGHYCETFPCMYFSLEFSLKLLIYVMQPEITFLFNLISEYFVLFFLIFPPSNNKN